MKQEPCGFAGQWRNRQVQRQEGNAGAQNGGGECGFRQKDSKGKSNEPCPATPSKPSLLVSFPSIIPPPPESYFFFLTAPSGILILARFPDRAILKGERANDGNPRETAGIASFQKKKKGNPFIRRRRSRSRKLLPSPFPLRCIAGEATTRRPLNSALFLSRRTCLNASYPSQHRPFSSF